MNDCICSAKGNARVAREQLPPICFLCKAHIFRYALRVLLANGLLFKAEIVLQLLVVSFIEPC